MRGFWAIVVVLAAAWAQAGDYVVAVSVDGMGSSYVQALLDAGRLPHLQRLLAEGAATLNARNDHDVTVTLPNHVSMVTSRPIQGEAGHGWTSNTDPAKGMTIHSNRGVYVASVFDAVHDHGRRTGVWASKTKFSLLRDSYDADHGAPDGTGVDNGRNKIDTFVYNKSSEALTADFVASMSTQPCHFAFVHFTETDSAGHTSGWGSSAYNEALVMLDGCLGRIVGLIATNTALAGKTTLLVTADHGGKDGNHSDAAEPLDYTVPLVAWGAGVAKGDLYAHNVGVRLSPGAGRPDAAAAVPPIRNAEVGNLALGLLGLDPIPGSVFNVRQDLRLAPVTR